jgi:MRG-binding protein
MPPRKKQKLSSQGVSTPSHDTSLPTPTQATGATKDDAEYEAIVNDRWTDEQETALLKGVIRWKPVGLSHRASNEARPTSMR